MKNGRNFKILVGVDTEKKYVYIYIYTRILLIPFVCTRNI
jgi:hypothetical protein